MINAFTASLSIYGCSLPMRNRLKLIASLPICLLVTSCSNEAENTQTATTADRNADATTQSTEVMRIAAAANLAGVLPAVIDAYQAEHSQNTETQTPKIEVTYASSGKLYAQISSGAPYDLFLSADQSYPAKYAQQQQNKSDNTNSSPQPFTYARGQLALYSSNQDLSEVKTLETTSLQQLFKPNSQSVNNQTAVKISLANPQLAPYGASAQAFLQQQGIYEQLNDSKQLIQAENIGQAFQYTHTATTDYGFVALSQLISANVADSKYLTLQPDSYPAILQDGIVISDHAQATDFSHYLKSQPAQQIFSQAGYLAVND